jgi:hypothetical protein
MVTKSFVVEFTGKQLAHIAWLCRNQVSEISQSVLLEVIHMVSDKGCISGIPSLTRQERESLVNSHAYKERQKRIKNES